ncbi:MAG: hypothetical protein ABFD50_08220 [Smithella sp.]
MKYPTEQITQIMSAYYDACQKHPEFVTDLFRASTILSEESGEVAKAVIDHHYSNGSVDDIITELSQTAAVCIRMLVLLDEMKKDNQ